MTPLFLVEVIGSRDRIAVEAAVDTCFEGHVCLPVNIAIQLGLELKTRIAVEYGDGRRVIELVFSGQARFLGEVQPVDIILTESEDVTIGTALMADCRLTVDFPTGRVTIVRSAKAG